MFVTFEGCDGAGKTTQMNLLAEYLREQGKDVVVTRELGGTPVGEKIREIFLMEHLDRKAELMLIIAARAQHLKNVIKPSLKEGIWVLCDRFYHSTYVYQYGYSALPQDQELRNLVECQCFPNLTFILDAAYEVCLSRIKARDTLTRFEDKGREFFEGIRNNFRGFGLTYHKDILVDAERPVEEVQKEIQIILEQRIKFEINLKAI